VETVSPEPLGAARTHETHEVTNQAPPLVGHDVAEDPVLLEGLRREGADWYVEDLHRVGRLAGAEQAQIWAEEANRNEPELRTHDRYGHRIDEVAFHPSYHALMDVAVREGLAGAPWAQHKPGTHVARAAGFMAWSTVEQGHGCPISMTYAVVPALRGNPELAAEYEPLLTSRVYDPGLRTPLGKRGLLAGHGDDREAGRLGRARQFDHCGAAARRHLAAARAQVVHQRADERPVPRARAGARRACPASWCRACCRTGPATRS
jgi:putative acyl-CoA dehydrogenase